ncbi:MAG: hypothetical protein R3B72_12045 [Polyangiaceae bacterium]
MASSTDRERRPVGEDAVLEVDAATDNLTSAGILADGDGATTSQP